MGCRNYRPILLEKMNFSYLTVVNNQILFVADINRKVILMKNLIFALRISHGSGSSECS